MQKDFQSRKKFFQSCIEGMNTERKEINFNFMSKGERCIAVYDTEVKRFTKLISENKKIKL